MAKPARSPDVNAKKPVKRKARTPAKRKPIEAKTATSETLASTVPKEPVSPAAHLAPYQFAPGQSGNPKGRTKGSRNKLGEAFLTDLQADWELNGVDVIAKVRVERPHEYLKVVASILPKELNVRVDPLDEMDDNELAAIVAAARAAILFSQEGGADTGAPPRSQPSGLI